MQHPEGVRVSKLLIEEPPLQVVPTLAVRLGLNEAIALQQLHYALRTIDSRATELDGVRWLRAEMTFWTETFPWWSEATIQRVWKALRDRHIVQSKRGREANVYTIDYTELARQCDGSDSSHWGGGTPQIDARNSRETEQQTKQEASAAPAADGVLPGFDPPPAEPKKVATGPTAEEEALWGEYLDVFGDRVRTREITPARLRVLRGALKASGGDSDIQRALSTCKDAIHGLKSYRQAHPAGSSDVSLDTIFKTGPHSKSNLTDQIEWWAAQANANTGGHGDRLPLDLVGVPPVTAGFIHQRRREVANMVAHPDSDEYREVGERAAALMRERYNHEYVVEDGRIRWRFVGDK